MSKGYVAAAFVMTCATLALGYLAFGSLTALIFTAGFAGGFVLWVAFPSDGSWPNIRTPYFLSLALFALHRIEENQSGFFARLAEISETSTPALTSPALIALLLASVGTWFSIPILLKRKHPLGAYFAWTFFASMGLTELAHFLVFPFLTGNPFTYFPGMASVVVLAPAAWWGMWRLAAAKKHTA
jgi:hypothetical protein